MIRWYSIGAIIDNDNSVAVDKAMRLTGMSQEMMSLSSSLPTAIRLMMLELSVSGGDSGGNVCVCACVHALMPHSVLLSQMLTSH